MDYIDLVKNVALLKTALHFLDDGDKEVKTFKSEVNEVIKDYEQQKITQECDLGAQKS